MHSRMVELEEHELKNRRAVGKAINSYGIERQDRTHLQFQKQIRYRLEVGNRPAALSLSYGRGREGNGDALLLAGSSWARYSIDICLTRVLSPPEPVTHGRARMISYHFFFCFLGGVMGLPVLMPP